MVVTKYVVCMRARLYGSMALLRAGGTEISFTMAIDYTASNGSPADPRSLHYVDPAGVVLNDYAKAMSGIGRVLEFYGEERGRVWLILALSSLPRTPPSMIPVSNSTRRRWRAEKVGYGSKYVVASALPFAFAGALCCYAAATLPWQRRMDGGRGVKARSGGIVER